MRHLTSTANDSIVTAAKEQIFTICQ